MPVNPELCVRAGVQGKPIDFTKSFDVNIVRGKTAIVTGGANGIGRAVALALADAGAHVVIADVQESAGKQFEQELTSKAIKAMFCKVDTTSFEQQAAVFKTVLAWSGRIDIVVAAAGIGTTDLRTFIRDKQHEEPAPPPLQVLDVNLKGVYYTSYLALFYFNKLTAHRSSGLKPQLLVVSSLAGYTTVPSATDYTAAKYGVRGLWKSIRVWAAECGGAQTNLMAPTYLDTNMIAEALALLKDGGAKVASLSDAVAAALRVICDDDIDSRAVCVASGEKEPGSHNFDLDDDMPGGDGAKVDLKRQEGVFGEIFL